MSDDQRKAMREADKERKAKRRAAMTKEEKSAVKEEDRLRKAMKKTSQVDGRTLPRLLAQKKGGLTRPLYFVVRVHASTSTLHGLLEQYGSSSPLD